MHQYYPILADLVLTTHVLFVLLVVLSLIAIIIGALLRWTWVRNPWFRLAHLLGIAVVVAQAWAGIICPLTTLEMWLRESAGQSAYSGSFIQHWLQQLLYYSAPDWVFTLAYTVFGAAVLLSLVLVPPRFGNR